MKTAIKLQRLINDFAAVNRTHYVASTNQHESDVHHSYSVAMLAWQINDALKLGLDMAKVMQYALVHDLVEVYAGDVNAYADERVRSNKKTAEAKALRQIEEEFGEYFSGLTKAMEIYEEKSDPEAHFVWTIDKIQAMVQGKADAYRPFYEQGLKASDVQRVHGGHGKIAYPPLKDHYAAILHEFLKDYDDTATNQTGKVVQKSEPPRHTNE